MTLAKQIATRFIERSKALKYKGKKRDSAALDFFCGAAVAFEEAGMVKESQTIGAITAAMISVRGFAAVQELAEKA